MSRFRKEILLLCDTAILLAAAILFYYFTKGLLGRANLVSGELVQNVLLVYACVLLFQLVFKTYDSLWRYAESREYLILLIAVVCGLGLYEILNRLILTARLPTAYLIGVTSLWLLGMLFLRFMYRMVRNRQFLKQTAGKGVPTAIIGAGWTGVQLLNELRHDPDCHYDVQCFIDDDRTKRHSNIHGVPVIGTVGESSAVLEALGIHQVILAIPSASEQRRQQVMKLLSRQDGMHISTLPNVVDLMERKPIRTQLRELRIEDLLGREPVQLNAAPVDEFLGGKVVLVTGGGGSIGSELCRKIAKHSPKKLIILDVYENSAYDIQQELKGLYGGKLDLSVEIASMRDWEQIHSIFAKYRPDIVFHAAAHKHVPLMEANPQEAVWNNVFGTLNVVRAADESRVRKFILISTDKAVNPTSVMGATKRLCEMILQSMNGRSSTCFASVRFGNVLGSNGSVVPLFKRQIAAGGPVTITDKRIIRYFMTISEAAQLVLMAGAMAQKNELFVLDMGQPVKILDLAENLIRLSGFEPYRDINIVEVGLRPGEKLYEELLISGRNIKKTENDQIYVESQPPVTPEEMELKLKMLKNALSRNEPADIRVALHAVIPTFHEPDEVNSLQAAAGRNSSEHVFSSVPAVSGAANHLAET